MIKSISIYVGLEKISLAVFLQENAPRESYCSLSNMINQTDAHIEMKEARVCILINRKLPSLSQSTEYSFFHSTAELPEHLQGLFFSPRSLP
jgi:hypothetical protein